MKIAIFGAGNIANKAYLPLLSHWRDIDISGIFSRTLQRANTTAISWKIDNPTNDVDYLISLKPACAFVLTEKRSHFNIIRKLLQNNIDVFVEKPLTMTTSEARELADLADNNKCILMVSFNRRYSLLYKQAHELLDNREIDLASFNKFRSISTNLPSDLQDYLLEDLIHQIDLIRFYCNEATAINTNIKRWNGKLVSFTCQLVDDRGGLITLNAGLREGCWEEYVTLLGKQFSIRVDAFSQIIIKDAINTISFGGDRPGKWADQLIERGFFGSVEHFFECVQNRDVPRTSARETIKTHILIDQILSVLDSQ